jgi:dipeptidyl aminopeptidase/acylaminoacyl peptidase
MNHGAIGVAAVAILVSSVARPATEVQTPAGAVLSAETLTLPAFADLPKGSRPGTEAEYTKARADPRFEMLRVVYASDGLPVVAFVFRPSATRDRLPVIVYNRGSYVRQNAAPELLVTLHRLADAGFVVVAPMYRGSEGAPGRDEMGGADLADLVHIQPVIASLPYADAASTFLYGESRGGMMTLQALRDGFPARAAAIVGAFTDLEQLLKEDSTSAAAARQIWPDYAVNHAAIADRRSAVRWADRISAPLLIMHGRDDPQVSPAHALQLAAALQRSGRTYELVIAAGAGHVLQPFEAERDERAIRWFRRHLRPGLQ